jgi:hypothetical protein
LPRPILWLLIASVVLTRTTHSFPPPQRDADDWFEQALRPGHPWKISDSMDYNARDEEGEKACSSTALRKARNPEEVEVAKAGYYLLKQYKSVRSGDLAIVVAAIGSSDQCRWDELQGFIFLGGAFVSRLAPDVMLGESSGGFIEARVLDSKTFEVDFEDFDHDGTRYKNCMRVMHKGCGFVTVTFKVRPLDSARSTSNSFTVKPLSFKYTQYPDMKE